MTASGRELGQPALALLRRALLDQQASSAKPVGLTAPVSEIQPRESARHTGASSRTVSPGPP